MQPERDPSEKLLFTPGPLTTSATVKQAMMRDAGSWHWEFNEMVARVRQKLLAVAGVSRDDGYECILLQGSGTYGLEAVVGSGVPRGAKFLVAINGAYGERIARIAEVLGVETVALRYREHELPSAGEVRSALADDPAIAMVCAVHCETTTGILNPIAEIGRAVKEAGRLYFVDAMSSFGAIDIDVRGIGIDYLVSSANKCIEGVPGFSFVIARRQALIDAETGARSLSLDLLAQLRGFEKGGQFRFTPPTHTILAFDQALRELEDEGGVAGRGDRYRANHETLIAGMRDLGFRQHLAPDRQSFIITSFHYPAHPAFDFDTFYRALAERGFIIYPGKLSAIDCFRIGSIGRLFPEDFRNLLAAIAATLKEVGVPVPVPEAASP
ncbi:MAG: 2-aminoethylphosphonate--pyruvate transaminase [Dehalococcoidia bacterium]